MSRAPLLLLSAVSVLGSMMTVADAAPPRLGNRNGGVVQQLQNRGANAPQVGNGGVIQQLQSRGSNGTQLGNGAVIQQLQQNRGTTQPGGVVNQIRSNLPGAQSGSSSPGVLQNLKSNIQGAGGSGSSIGSRLQNLPAPQSSSSGSSGLQNLARQLQSRQSGGATSRPGILSSLGSSSAHSSGSSSSTPASGSGVGAPLPLPIPVPNTAFGAPPASGVGATAIQSAVAEPNPADLPAASNPPAFTPPAVVQQAQQPIDDAGSNNAALALAIADLSDEELLVLLALLQARLERNNPPATPAESNPPPAPQDAPTAETRLTSIPDTDDFTPSSANNKLPRPQTSYQRAIQIANENGGRVVTRVENGVTYYDILVNR